LKRRILVLDTSAFIMGYNPLSSEEEQYSTPAVKEELRPGDTPRLRFEMAESLGKLRSMSPPAEYLAELEAPDRYTKTGGELSRADREVIALALKLRSEGLDPVLVTDDYDVQNVAEAWGLRYAPLAQLGIKYHYTWVLQCTGCRRIYPPMERSATCRICGATLKRRVGRAERAHRKLAKP